MTLLDTIVRGRERITNRILGTNPYLTLNSRRSPSAGISGGNSLAGEIKDLLNQIKNLAFSENGKVDYGKLIQDQLYQSYRDLAGELAHFELTNLKSTPEKMAFWINLYNALVIDAVIQENVQKSVTESRLGIMAFFERAAYRVNNLRFSLGDIEHGLLRANRGFPYFPGPHFASGDLRLKVVITPFDPRIHFALNCASNSCPPIAVYSPEKIQAQLDLAARNFINSDLISNPSRKQISISRIFRWYQDDFGGKTGVLSTLSKYINDQDTKLWLSKNHSSIQVQYHSYDWGLNKIAN